MTPPQRSQRRTRAANVYAVLLRLYPHGHREAFGEQMLQAFRDQYRDVVEVHGESEARYWLAVIGDAGKSVVREHLAALAERIWPMQTMQTILVAPFLVWRRRQTRRLALVAQLYLIAAVLLVWTPLLVGRVLLATAQHGLMHAISGTVTYSINAAVERPTTQFLSAFTQATDEIATHELHTYHFSSSRVELSTFPLALAGEGASVASTSTPPFLLDGEPAVRLATDLHVVAGRLPMPAVGALEVVVTQTTADQLHLALGAALPIPALAGHQAPVVRVVGIVQTTGSVFPTDRVAFDPVNQDMVWGWAQSHPLDYVLTSDEAIGTYSTAYDWAQVAGLDAFSSPSPTGTRLLTSANPQLWQAWWIATTDYARMDAQALTAFIAHTAPDPSPRLNQLLDVSPLAQQAGFAPGGTFAHFYEGNHDDEDATTVATLNIWIFAILVAALMVVILWPLASLLAERQQPLLAALRNRARGASRGRVAIIGTLAAQALAPTGLALLVGGALAMLLAGWVVAALMPEPARPLVTRLVSGPLDTGYGFGLAGGIATVLLALAAPVVMLYAMCRTMPWATTAITPELASDHQSE